MHCSTLQSWPSCSSAGLAPDCSRFSRPRTLVSSLPGVGEAHRGAPGSAGAAAASVAPAAPSRSIRMSGPSAVALLTAIGKDLARPHLQPAVGELDLFDRHRAGVGQPEQQRVAVGRIAGDADALRQQGVRHRGDRAFEHLGQPVVRVQLLPQRRRRHAAREAVHEHELLADVQAALQQLGLDARELGIALEQRLEAGRILLPQAPATARSPASAASRSRSPAGCGLPA